MTKRVCGDDDGKAGKANEKILASARMTMEGGAGMTMVVTCSQALQASPSPWQSFPGKHPVSRRH